MHLAAQAPYRRGPLSSNVRPHRKDLLPSTIFNSQMHCFCSRVPLSAGKPALVLMAISGCMHQVIAISTHIALLAKTR
jgi:hypothetical protein